MRQIHPDEGCHRSRASFARRSQGCRRHSHRTCEKCWNGIPERYVAAVANLLEHLNPFSDQGKINEGEAGDIAAGARQGGHETLSNWIVNEAKYDWDGVGCLFQGCNNRRAAADDDVRCRTDHLRRVGLDSVHVSSGVAMLELDIAVLDPAKRLESLPKGNNAC